MRYQKLSGYKYALAETLAVALHAEFPACQTSHFELCGRDLTIRAGYQWDGASGPTVDTRSTMCAALVHDALYQGIRSGVIPAEMRFEADLELYRLMRQRGVDDAAKAKCASLCRVWAEFRALYFFAAVRLFGASSCRPSRGKKERQEIILEV